MLSPKSSAARDRISLVVGNEVYKVTLTSRPGLGQRLIQYIKRQPQITSITLPNGREIRSTDLTLH